MPKQSNSRYRSFDDLNPRDREHFEVARSLSSNFTAAEFKERYADIYPARAAGSIIPSDYAFNRENKGNHLYPRFLEWHGGHRYSFVGLDGGEQARLASAAPPSADR
jgi:hypothetical protein